MANPAGTATPVTRTRIAATRDVEEFARAVSDVFRPITVSSERANRFHGRIRSRSLASVTFSEAVANQHRLARTAEQIGGSRSDLVMLNLQLSGMGSVRQGGRTAQLFPGDITVYSEDEPYELDLDDRFRTVAAMFPRSALDLTDDDVDELAAVRIPAADAMTQILSALLTEVLKNLDRLSPAVEQRIAAHMADLVATTLLAFAGAARTPEQTRRAALVTAVKAYITEHLGEPDLGPRQIAAAHYVSLRHLYDVFEPEPTTISAWIRERRLERCTRALSDPRAASRPVAMIAADSGFVDAPHFCRLFKRTYSITPTEFRVRTMNGGQPDA